MLRSLPPTPANDQTDQHRAAHRATKHISVLRGQIENLVHRQEREIGTDVRGDRIVTYEGSTDRHTRHSFFHPRYIEDPRPTVFLGKADRRTEDTFEVVDTLTHDEDVGMIG